MEYPATHVFSGVQLIGDDPERFEDAEEETEEDPRPNGWSSQH